MYIYGLARIIVTVNDILNRPKWAKGEHMNTFKVNFKSGAVYCANLAKAETAEAVARHYSKYEWFAVKPATAGDIREAEAKGMPVCIIAEEPAPAEEPATSPKTGEITDKVRRREARYTAAVRAAKNAILGGEDTAAERVTISRGNDKMGAIPSVSLMPLTTCPECARATCGNYCYAAAMADNGARKNIAASYARNTAIALTNPAGYWAAVRGAIAAARFFRFHVSGDAISREYVAEIFRAAEDFPRCDILIFTKRFAWFNVEISARGGVIPGNLHVMFSGGAGIEIPNPYRIPVALFVPHGEEIPAEAKICGGNCLECGCRGVGCWQLAAGDVLALKEHGNGHKRERGEGVRK